MHIVLGILGEIVIHHVRNALYVNTSPCYVGSH
jgi:hypothetical protein